MDSEKTYSIADASRQLKVSRQTLYAWIAQGEVETVSLKNGRQGITQATLSYLLKIIKPTEKRSGKTANYLLYDVEVVKVRRS